MSDDADRCPVNSPVTFNPGGSPAEPGVTTEPAAPWAWAACAADKPRGPGAVAAATVGTTGTPISAAIVETVAANTVSRARRTECLRQLRTMVHPF